MGSRLVAGVDRGAAGSPGRLRETLAGAGPERLADPAAGGLPARRLGTGSGTLGAGNSADLAAQPAVLPGSDARRRVRSAPAAATVRPDAWRGDRPAAGEYPPHAAGRAGEPGGPRRCALGAAGGGADAAASGAPGARALSAVGERSAAWPGGRGGERGAGGLPRLARGAAPHPGGRHGHRPRRLRVLPDARGADALHSGAAPGEGAAGVGARGRLRGIRAAAQRGPAAPRAPAGSGGRDAAGGGGRAGGAALLRGARSADLPGLAAALPVPTAPALPGAARLPGGDR